MPLVGRGRLGLLALAAGCFGTAMCVSDFDTRRQVPAERGTVGAEVFHVVCERVDVGESPDDLDFERARGVCDGEGVVADGGGTMAVGPKVRTMGERRSAIVAAIDRAIPRALYDDADGMLFNLLPLYGSDNGRDGGTTRLADGGTAPRDEDLLPQTTRAVSRLLTSIVNDASAPAALAAFSHHQGYRPPRIALGLTRALLGYPHLGDVLESTFSLVRDADIAHMPGAARDHFHALLDMASGELARAAPATAADAQSGTTLDAVADLVFRTDPSLATGHPRLVVRRDPFGMARIAQAGGSLPSPFVDVMPMDGFADSREGQYVDSHGRPLSVLTPFQANDAPDGMRDAEGRAVSSGLTVYEYVDLDQSLIGALLHDARSLVDPANSVALRFAHGASALLGPRAPATRDFMLNRACPTASDPAATCAVPPVQYSSFDTSRNAPLADFVHAVGLLLTHTDGDRILAAAQSLMTDHEPVMARALGAMLAITFDSGVTLLGLSAVPLASFAGSVGALLVVYGLSVVRRRGTSTMVLLLGGVTLTALLSAVMGFVQFMADFTQTFRNVRWMMGSLDVAAYAPLV
ncbi:MAG: iron chelate uptake ABC transporter family permease subunit, partial [Deltaproteobacteria bacterium]